jgi:hypothetical protein
MCKPANPTYTSVFDLKFEPLSQTDCNAIVWLSIADTWRENNSHRTPVCRVIVTPFPPWLSPVPYAMLSNENMPLDICKALFVEFLDQFRRHLTMYTDGSKKAECRSCSG